MSIAADRDYIWLTKQVEVFKEFRPSEGDKLAITADGDFTISPGGFWQPFSRSWHDCTQGGYNRESVLLIFQNLVAKLEDLFGRIDAQKDPDTAQAFIYAVSLAGRALAFNHQIYLPSDISTHFLHSLNLLISQEVSFLSEEELEKRIEEYKTTSSKILSETSCCKTLLKIILFIPLVFLSILKWVFWNPLEFCFRQEIQTENPFTWLQQRLKPLPIEQKAAFLQFKLTLMNLIEKPNVLATDVKRFLKLAPLTKMKQIDLSHLSIEPKDGSSLISSEALSELIMGLALLPKGAKLIPPAFLIPNSESQTVDVQYQSLLADLVFVGLVFDEASSCYKKEMDISPKNLLEKPHVTSSDIQRFLEVAPLTLMKKIDLSHLSISPQDGSSLISSEVLSELIINLSSLPKEAELIPPAFLIPNSESQTVDSQYQSLKEDLDFIGFIFDNASSSYKKQTVSEQILGKLKHA